MNELPPTPLSSGPGRYSLITGLVVGLITALTANAAESILRMPNGEILRGTIVRQDTEVIVFESDSFGRLTVPRTDGVALSADVPPIASSPSPPVAKTATSPGSSAADDEKNGQAPPRAWLAEALGLSKSWSGSMELGIDALNGEIDGRSYNFRTTVEYKKGPHEAGVRGTYSYRTVNDIPVIDSTEIIGRYFFLPEDKNWLLINQADWLRDPLNLVEHRTNLVGVPAWRFVDTKKWRFLLGLGPSYRAETRLVPDGTDLVETDHESLRGAFYQVLFWQIQPQLSLRQSLLVQQDVSESENRSIRVDAGINRMLTEHLSLGLSYSLNEDDNAEFGNQRIATLTLMMGYNF